MMTDAPTSANPPPGWYADSPQAVRLRWWNGSAWTDHYQVATDASSTQAALDAPAAVVESEPTTRAARRAATAAGTTGAPASPVVESAPKPVARADASLPEPFPDQILSRAPRMGEYRPPPRPVTYQPRVTNYAAPAPSTFIPVTSSNGPAAASLAISVVGLAAGVLVHLWITPARPTLAGLCNLLIIAAFFCAVALAIVGLVLSAQRPTRKGRSVVALVISTLLFGGTCVLFALRMIPVGAISGAG